MYAHLHSLFLQSTAFGATTRGTNATSLVAGAPQPAPGTTHSWPKTAARNALASSPQPRAATNRSARVCILHFLILRPISEDTELYRELVIKTSHHHPFSPTQQRLTAPGVSTRGGSATRIAGADFSMALGPSPATQMAAQSVKERPRRQGAATLIRAQVRSEKVTSYEVFSLPE